MKLRDALVLLMVLIMSFGVTRFTPLGSWIKSKLMPPLSPEIITAWNGEINDYFLDDPLLN